MGGWSRTRDDRNAQTTPDVSYCFELRFIIYDTRLLILPLHGDVWVLCLWYVCWFFFCVCVWNSYRLHVHPAICSREHLGDLISHIYASTLYRICDWATTQSWSRSLPITVHSMCVPAYLYWGHLSCCCPSKQPTTIMNRPYSLLCLLVISSTQKTRSSPLGVFNAKVLKFAHLRSLFTILWFIQIKKKL